MPQKMKVTITADYPMFLGEHDGVGQRKVDLLHVHELAENFILWKDKPLLLWKKSNGVSYVIGGQHRMTALREFIFPATKVKKFDMDSLVYTVADIPNDMLERDFILLLIHSDNAGKENSSFDIAQLDHKKLWYSLPKSYGIEFGNGGNSKTLHTEVIIRATTIARGLLETGRFVARPWLNTFASDTDTHGIEKAILYARWWDENVAMPVHKTNARINMLKPTVLSLLLAVALDPANGLPQDPVNLTASKTKQRTLMEAPTKLMACSLYDRTKGNSAAVIWSNLLEPINAAKKKGNGRLYVGGNEKWV
jgi:hypothetical protein